MGAVSNSIINTLQNAPLPLMIEKLGLAIAEAQLALDRNAIQLANQMALTEMTMPDGRSYNLLAVGFKPTFYAFTEASVEVSMEFSLAESESFSIGGGLSFGNANTNSSGSGSANTNTNASGGTSSSFSGEGQKETKMFGVSLSGYYASKFSTSAKGASSIAARIISLPAPDRYQEILRQLAGDGNALPFKVNPPSDQTFATAIPAPVVEVNVQVSGGVAPYTYAWSNSLGTDAVADIGGLSVGTYTITVTVSDSENASEEVEFEVIVT